MNIIFLFLTNVILTFATDAPRPKNHQFYEDDQQLSSYGKKESKSKIGRDNKFASHGLKQDRATIDKDLTEREVESVNPLNLSKERDRIQFQVEGHEGPQTYIFGFDTGHGKSRQYRLEEKLPDGTVKGQYGYYDAKGKLRTVRYVARPFEGYTERHHESNIQKLKN